MIEVETFGEVQSLHQGKELWGLFPPYMTVRCYAVDGLLIDSGLSCFQQAVGEFARQRGVHQAVITHHHEDHSGNARYLQGQGVDVRSSSGAVGPMRQGFSRYFYQRLVWCPAPLTQLQESPSVIETERYSFQVIEAPGHCEDQIVLHEAKQGWLFTGDAFLSSRVKYFRGDEDFAQTLSTLRKLCQLPFDSVFCAHSPVVHGGKSALLKKLQHLTELEEKVRDLHGQGLPLKEITRRVLGAENKLLFAISLGDLSKRNLVRSILYGPRKRPF